MYQAILYHDKIRETYFYPLWDNAFGYNYHTVSRSSTPAATLLINSQVTTYSILPATDSRRIRWFSTSSHLFVLYLLTVLHTYYTICLGPDTVHVSNCLGRLIESVSFHSTSKYILQSCWNAWKDLVILVRVNMNPEFDNQPLYLSMPLFDLISLFPVTSLSQLLVASNQ